MTMTQINPLGRVKGGRINAKVEPSSLVDHGETGVFMEVDDHFRLSGSALHYSRDLGRYSRDIEAII